MKNQLYLLDTHALIFWDTQTSVNEEFIRFFDKQNHLGNILVSSITFWETALLAKKGKIELEDVEVWKNELLKNTNIVLIDPTVSEMIASTQLPDHHKDPFDRLLIVQAIEHNALLVSKDKYIADYDAPVFWIP